MAGWLPHLDAPNNHKPFVAGVDHGVQRMQQSGYRAHQRAAAIFPVAQRQLRIFR